MTGKWLSKIGIVKNIIVGPLRLRDWTAFVRRAGAAIGQGWITRNPDKIIERQRTVRARVLGAAAAHSKAAKGQV